MLLSTCTLIVNTCFLNTCCNFRLVDVTEVPDVLHLLNLTLKEVQEILTAYSLHKNDISAFLPQGKCSILYMFVLYRAFTVQ